MFVANHSSHADFVLIWASLPGDLRIRTRPVAGADYWTTTRLRRGLINDVLNFARVEAGHVELVIKDVALAEIVEGLEALVAPGENGVVVRDLGSTNGSFVRGARFGELVLGFGTEIQIGQTHIKYVPEEEAVEVALASGLTVERLTDVGVAGIHRDDAVALRLHVLINDLVLADRPDQVGHPVLDVLPAEALEVLGSSGGCRAAGRGAGRPVRVPYSATCSATTSTVSTSN